MKDLSGRVAAVTGAGSGIGQAICLELAKKGCHIAAMDVNPDGLKETADQLADYDVKVTQHVADVSNRARMQEVAEEVVTEHGKVELLFNNAGVTISRTFEEHSVKDWEFVLGINLWGVIYGCMFFLPHLKKAGEAHIINTSSMAGFMGMPTQVTYGATKAAVKSMSETMWHDLAPDNIRVTCVHPGAIKTNIMQAHMDKAGDPERFKAIAEKTDRMAMPVDKAARIIVRAVEKNKMRVLVGRDAYILEFLKRLMPVTIHRLLARAVKNI